MSARLSHSSRAGLPVATKLSEWSAHFRMRWERARNGPDFRWLVDDLAEYDRFCRRYVGRSLRECRVLEIGFGARPYRLLALSSLCREAVGIDLDVPVLGGGPREFARILRTNGVERALKSLVRHYLFDVPERRAFADAVAALGGKLALRRDAFHVGDAGDAATWERLPPGSFDLVVSEDVLEHIATEAIPAVLEHLDARLAPSGIALLRPCIFTGISGGHRPEWYPHLVDRDLQRATPAWGHLRNEHAPANCFLNRLTRASYREHFRARFEIAEEVVKYPGLGRRHLDPALREELARWSEDELFSNVVLFVLRRRRALP